MAKCAAITGKQQNCPVLLVDDDDGIRGMVAEVLEFEGYWVVTAVNGEDALRLIEGLRATDPDCPRVLLLDMRMPVLDGWGVAQALEDRHIPMSVIVMTAATDARRWAEEIGADAYLAKPFELDELLTTITRLIGPPR